MHPSAIPAVARQFQLAGELLSAEPFGSGRINDTFCVTFHQGGARRR